jgi:tight adherence protein B
VVPILSALLAAAAILTLPELPAHERRWRAIRLPLSRGDVPYLGGGCTAALVLGLPLHTVLVGVIFATGTLIAWRQSAAGTTRRKLRAVVPAVAQGLAAALRSGLPLPEALAAVAAAQPEPVAASLRTTSATLRLGRRLDSALAPLDELFGPSFLLVHESLRAFHRRGGNVARSLERAAALARAEAEVQDEIHALTAQGRMSALVLALLAPCGFMFSLIANPSGAQGFIADPRGGVLLSAALVLEAIGAYWLWRLVRR